VDIHKNARTTAWSRAEIIRQVREVRPEYPRGRPRLSRHAEEPPAPGSSRADERRERSFKSGLNHVPWGQPPPELVGDRSKAAVAASLDGRLDRRPSCNSGAATVRAQSFACSALARLDRPRPPAGRRGLSWWREKLAETPAFVADKISVDNRWASGGSLASCPMGQFQLSAQFGLELG